MGQVDSLSRRADWVEEVERDNEDQVMLKKEQSEIRVMEKGQLLIERAKEEIIEKIEVVRVVEKMKKTEVIVLRNDKQQIEDKLVLKKEKIYVLKNKSLRLEVGDYLVTL